MQISSSSQQEPTAPHFRSYEKFAATSYDEDKIVVGVDGHKIQIATKSPYEPKLSSYLEKNGLKYELSQEAKNAVVDHFKKALELKYGGEVADISFSLTDEAEALEHGLSHRIVKEVTNRAHLLHLVRKIPFLIQTINKLEKDDPLFEREMKLEEARNLIQEADDVLCHGDSELSEDIKKLEDALLAAKDRISSSQSNPSSRFSSMTSLPSPKLDFGKELTTAHNAALKQIAEKQKTSSAAEKPPTGRRPTLRF